MKSFSNYQPAFYRLICAFVCTAISQILAGYFPKDYLLDEKFGNEYYVYKMFHTVGAMQCVIWNYFSGFCIIEANLIACGIGYANPDKNGSESFNNIRLVGIVPIESSTTFQYIG